MNGNEIIYCSEIDAVSQVILVAAKWLARRRRDLSVFHLLRVLAIEITHQLTVEFLDLFSEIWRGLRCARQVHPNPGEKSLEVDTNKD